MNKNKMNSHPALMLGWDSVSVNSVYSVEFSPMLHKCLYSQIAIPIIIMLKKECALKPDYIFYSPSSVGIKEIQEQVFNSTYYEVFSQYSFQVATSGHNPLKNSEPTVMGGFLEIPSTGLTGL